MMTKKQIIRFLQSLRREQIDNIYVVYHNPQRGLLCLDTVSINLEYACFKLSLYRLRKDIKYVCVDYHIGDDFQTAIYVDLNFPICMSLFSYLSVKK